MCDLKGIRVGCAMTGSFCTFKRVFSVWKNLKAGGADLIPIMSFNACQLDTRFYTATEAVHIFEEITEKRIIKSIVDAEPIGPGKLLDVLAIAPCTGNSMAKIANGITDTPVTLAVKSHLRNGRPVVIAVSSNDSLSGNAQNIGKLLNTRNIFFVPMEQDDSVKKPNSLVANMEMLPKTIEMALKGQQIEPKLYRN